MFTSFKRILPLTAALGLFAPAPAPAFHFGLGNAAAAQGAKVINQANSEYMSSNGVLVPALPSCGSNMALFTAPPVIDPTFVAINPLGHIFPPGHTFPADHGYFGFSGSSANVNLYAPADGWVTQIITLYGSGNSSDGYVITFSPCREVTWANLTVNTLAPVLANPSGPTSTSCSSFGENFPGAVASCTTNMEAPVKAGEFLGTGGLVDFGPLTDTRMQLTGFIDPGRHDLNRGFCAVNYFVPSLRATYTAMLGGNNGATFIARTIPPICGTIVQDLAGTVQGDWFFPGAPYPPDDPHLALIHHNISPSTATFSVGSSIPGFSGGHDFSPVTTADGTRINYDWPLVNDTQIYCYDTLLIDLQNGAGGPDPTLAGDIVLLQMTDSQLDTLKIELQPSKTTCAASVPWAFTGAAVTFQR
jgi:hypothetical protein